MAAMAEAAWNVSGWRIFYTYAMEERWFEGSQVTPWESVFYSNFEDFVEKVALKNSRI